MIITTKVIGEGKYSVFIKECPKCGSERKLNEDAALKYGLVSAGGFLSTILVGAPVIGALGALGIIKLVVAGSLTIPVAIRAIKANYGMISKLPHDIFICTKCGNSDFTYKWDEILNKKLDKKLEYRRYLVLKNETKYDLNVNVIYYTNYVDGSWNWSEKKTWRINKGDYTYISDGDFKVNARFIYIWASSIPKREGDSIYNWDYYCCRPLKKGKPYLKSKDLEDFIFTFN
ncbi:MAG: hypothetical protein QXG00_08290 [Candidatus Woesearchaeota archaeon]